MLGRFAGMMGGVGAAGRRAGIGAGIGAAAGFMGAPEGRGLAGAFTGAAMGAVGGVGAGAGVRAMGRFGGVAGIAQRGIGLATRPGVRRMTRAVGNRFGRGATAVRAIDQAAWRSSAFIGRNAVQTNKWGGRALMGVGAASAGYIGASMLSSNRR